MHARFLQKSAGTETESGSRMIIEIRNRLRERDEAVSEIPTSE